MHRGQEGPCDPRPSHFWLACPKCSVACDFAKKSPFKPGRNIQLWCSSCKHAISSKKWSCSCGGGWMGCSQHRPVGYLCKARLSLKKREKPGLPQGVFLGTAKRRHTAPLGELGIHGPLRGRPSPPPPPPPGPPGKKLRFSPPPSSGSLGPPGVAMNPELSQALLIRPQARRPAGRGITISERCGATPAVAPHLPKKRVSLECPSGPGPSFGAGPSALSYRPPSKPYARPACKVAHVICVLGTGQCPASGWTIDQYCLKCHG